MTSGSFHVDPASIARQAPVFSAAGSDVQTALSTLVAALAGSATAIGHDKPGTNFATGYLPSERNIIAGLRTLVHGLNSVDPAVKAMAANYQGADNASRQVFGGR